MMSALAAQHPAVTAWSIDPVHSVAEFKVKHMMISNVKGRFSAISGTLALDEADLSGSSVETTIQAGSIDSGDAKRGSLISSGQPTKASTAAANFEKKCRTGCTNSTSSSAVARTFVAGGPTDVVTLAVR